MWEREDEAEVCRSSHVGNKEESVDKTLQSTNKVGPTHVYYYSMLFLLLLSDSFLCIKSLPATMKEAFRDDHHRDIYLDRDGNVRCRCNHKSIINLDAFIYIWHFKSVGHKKYLTLSDMEGVQQAALDELNTCSVAEEVARLSTVGTRATRCVGVD